LLNFTDRFARPMSGDGEAGAGQAAKLRFGGRLRRLPCGAYMDASLVASEF